MADCFPKMKRREVMSRVRSKDSKAELLVRKLLHALGYRFRLHQQKLPGKPDIVLPKLKKIILVHGCFWHGHSQCNRAKRPTTNTEFWNQKLEKNVSRDLSTTKALKALGWEILIVWECKTRDLENLKVELKSFLNEQ